MRSVAFLRAVFKEASKFITKPEIRDRDQIVEFSNHMSEGMRWGSHGEKRESFYKGVISVANEVR